MRGIAALGSVVAGFELVEQLAASPFPTFLAANEAGEKRRVVILPREWAEHDWEQINEDLRKWQNLADDHLIAAEDWGQRDQLYFLVYPRDENLPLDRCVEQLVRPSLHGALHLSLCLARHIDSLHQAKLIHGNLRPQTVLVKPDMSVVVQDVGLYLPCRNRAISRRDVSDPFSAPELGYHADARCDVYSVGRILLYLLTADSRGFYEYDEANHRWRDPESNSTRQTLTDVPASILPVLERTLATNAEYRYPAMADFAATLQPLVEELPVGWMARIQLEGGEKSREQIPEPSDGDRQDASLPFKPALTTLLLLPVLVLVMALAIASIWERPVFSTQGPEYKAANWIATLPGRNGIWWAEDDERYFLTPSFRAKTAKAYRDGSAGRAMPLAKATRRNELSVLRKELQTAAEASRSPALGALNPASPDGDRLVTKLDWLLGKYPPRDGDAARHHLRATLLHKSLLMLSNGGTAEARSEVIERSRDEYEAAIASYPWHQPGLRALCHSDLGRLLSLTGHPEETTEQFDQAIDVLCRARNWPRDLKANALFAVSAPPLMEAVSQLNSGKIPDPLRKNFKRNGQQLNSEATVSLLRPGQRWRIDNGDEAYIVGKSLHALDVYDPMDPVRPLLVSILCRQAAIERSRGAWDQAEDKLWKAMNTSLFDVRRCPKWKNKDHRDCNCSAPSELAIFTLERQAWLLMDRWQVDRAQHNFLVAEEGRRELDLKFHNKHGRATALRYQGDAKAAVLYEQIIQDVERNLGTAEIQDDLDLKKRLEDRLLNSLERLGDCKLYSARGEDGYAAAVRSYSEALEELERQTLDKKRDRLSKAKLLYKIALATILCEQAPDSPPHCLVEFARSKLNEGDDILRKSLRAAATAPEGDGHADADASWLSEIKGLLRQGQSAPHRKNSIQRHPDKKLLCLRNIADVLIAVKERKAGDEELFQAIRDEFRRLSAIALLTRDELDVLLLSARRLAVTNYGSSRQHKLNWHLNLQLALYPESVGARLVDLGFLEPTCDHLKSVSVESLSLRDSAALGRLPTTDAATTRNKSP